MSAALGFAFQGTAEPSGAWARYVPELGALMKILVERLAAAQSLLQNVADLVGRSLG